jgi:signal transduction histidine kinase
MDASEHTHVPVVQHPFASTGEAAFTSSSLRPAPLTDMGAGALSFQALARGIITLADPHTPMPQLIAALSPLLPGTRLDILLATPNSGPLHVWLTTGSVELPPPPLAALTTETTFLRWLATQGYSAIEQHPLIHHGSPIGRLLLSRVTGQLDQRMRTLAADLAQAFLLRYDAGSVEADLQAATQALRAAEERLVAHERLRRQATLAAGSIHDFNNLLTVLLNYTELLSQEAPPALRQDLRAMDRAIQDGMVLVRRVLMEDNPLSHPAPITNISIVVEETIALTRPLWEREQQITLDADLASGVLARIDPVLMRQVLINLIMNAVDAMAEGGSLQLRTEALLDQVIVEVSDTGIGIAREYQSAIFEPLRTSKASGSGLGLAVSRQIVERAGGHLTVASAPGQGATFTITLPTLRY